MARLCMVNIVFEVKTVTVNFFDLSVSEVIVDLLRHLLALGVTISRDVSRMAHLMYSKYSLRSTYMYS